MNERIRTIIAEVSEEMEVKIENGVISSDLLHLFVVIPPHVAVSDFVQRAKGRFSRKVQQEFPELKKIYWERGYFSATSGHITDEVINEYINKHTDAHQPHYLAALPAQLTTFLLQPIVVECAVSAACGRHTWTQYIKASTC